MSKSANRKEKTANIKDEQSEPIKKHKAEENLAKYQIAGPHNAYYKLRADRDNYPKWMETLSDAAAFSKRADLSDVKQTTENPEQSPAHELRIPDRDSHHYRVCRWYPSRDTSFYEASPQVKQSLDPHQQLSEKGDGRASKFEDSLPERPKRKRSRSPEQGGSETLRKPKVKIVSDYDPPSELPQSQQLFHTKSLGALNSPQHQVTALVAANKITAAVGTMHLDEFLLTENSQMEMDIDADSECSTIILNSLNE